MATIEAAQIGECREYAVNRGPRTDWIRGRVEAVKEERRREWGGYALVRRLMLRPENKISSRPRAVWVDERNSYPSDQCRERVQA